MTYRPTRIAPAHITVATLFTDGWTMDQIAEHRGTSTWTVKAQLRDLRHILKTRGYTVNNRIRLGQALRKEGLT